MVRYQWAKIKGNTLDDPWNIDAGVSYLIKGPALRFLGHLRPHHASPGDTDRQLRAARRAGDLFLTNPHNTKET